jgi:hypothetical protein
MTGDDWRTFRRGLLVVAGLVVAFDTVNVFTTLQDRVGSGHPVSLWEPVIWEGSSGVVGIVLAPLVWAALRLAPPRRGGWLRFSLVHAPATLVVSALHVSGMVALRVAAYASVGAHYRFGGLARFPYEYRKDILSYVITAGVFWLVGEMARRRREEAAPQAPPTYDIREGARTIRARLEDIAAVSSAGNYVEFLLADGRRPLMRSTLAAVEAELGPRGFVRTHKSWLINAARVAEMTADGSGDFTLALDVGVTVPLSRRYPQALQRLRPATAAAEA